MKTFVSLNKGLVTVFLSLYFLYYVCLIIFACENMIFEDEGEIACVDILKERGTYKLY